MKLTIGEVFSIRKELVEGATLAETAKKYNISVSNVSAIKAFRSWQNVGVQFKDRLIKNRKRGRKRKLSPEIEAEIQRRHREEKTATLASLGVEYDVSLYTIFNIVHRND